MQYQSAWVNISGKVFVPQDEIDCLVEGNEGMTERQALEELARDKLSALFPSDDPFKYNDIDFLPA